MNVEKNKFGPGNCVRANFCTERAVGSRPIPVQLIEYVSQFAAIHKLAGIGETNDLQFVVWPFDLSRMSYAGIWVTTFD
jgi:hypothetical protein